jgi:antitoxin component YwqK of YwqJK toxin-antitoxin module
MKILLTLTVLLAVSASMLFAKEYVVEDNAQKSTYVDGVRQGMTWWYDDKHKIKSKVNFDKGKENGIYTSYYDNGKEKLVVEYVIGQKHNTQKIYYDNGQLGSQVDYNMGRREGVMTEWDYEGFKSSEVFYKHNYKVGVKKYFDHDGKVTFTQEFKMDRNPVMVKLLKDKREETLVDLAKYGLMPKDTPEKERLK